MKKIILMAAMFGTVTATQAQELRSKRGEYILPEAGDWSLGIDATPFLNYIGNFFGKTASNNAPSWNYLTQSQTITGKYFVTPNMAYRGTLRLGFGSMNDKNTVVARGTGSTLTFPITPQFVDNKYKMNSFNFGLGFGIEKRRGFTRLQGYYGAEVGFNVASQNEKYSYGNALTSVTATNPVLVDNVADRLNNGSNLVKDTYGNNARKLHDKAGTSFEFGVRGFLGAEYFLFPKISLGGEFGWGIGFQTIGESNYATESVDVTSGTGNVGQQTIKQAGSSSFVFDNDNKNSILGPSGALRLNLHF